MGRHAALRELRSLERQSMYSIFAPLDPDERLPRELLMEGRRYRQIGRRELAGALWLPALLLLVVILSALHVNPLLAFAGAGAGLIAVYVIVLTTKRP